MPGVKAKQNLRVAAYFEHVEDGGKIYQPKRADNAYVFPGLGFGAIIAGENIISDY